MNAIHENISLVVNHARMKQSGHDPFVMRYSELFSLEKLGLTKGDAPNAFHNRDQLYLERKSIDEKLDDLVVDQMKKTEEYHKEVDTLKKLEDRYKLGSIKGSSTPTQADNIPSSSFLGV